MKLKILILAPILLFLVNTAFSINVTEVQAIPGEAGLNEQIDVTAAVSSANLLDYVEINIEYPSGHLENYTMHIFSDFVEWTAPEPIPFNLTGIAETYNLTLDCHDFTDGSDCFALYFNISESCMNVTFDDEPVGGDFDLDIGVIACVEETQSNYIVNLTRWGYEATHELGVRYCFNSACSDWVINQTIGQYLAEYNKTMFGGFYMLGFKNTTEPGNYTATVIAQSMEDINNTETAYFRIAEINPPQILSYSLYPAILYEVMPITISAEVIDESGVEFVKARIEGPVDETISLDKTDSIYEKNHTLQIDGTYHIYLMVEDIYGNNDEMYIGDVQFLVPEIPPSAGYCRNINSIGIVSQPSILNAKKIQALMDSNYFCTKNILGLWNYDFYLELKYPDGTYFEIDGEPVVYGKIPPKTAKIMVFSQNLLVPSETLTSAILKLYLWV